jgi:PPM family protein phosphatase
VNGVPLDQSIVALGVVVALVAAVLVARSMLRGKPAEGGAGPRSETGRYLRGEATIPDFGETDEEVTVMVKVPSVARAEEDVAPSVEEEDDEPPPESTRSAEYGDDSDEHTGPRALILVTAVAHTDVGRERKNNEDNLLVMPDEPLFVVADGMGGYEGGEVASKIAVDVIGKAFADQSFPGMRRRTRHRRANEVLRAIELANAAVLREARASTQHKDMGTTIAAARFSPSKRRVYVANVGDSRVLRVRDGALTQLTIDHTLAVEAGVKGKLGSQLSRAVGVTARVQSDIRVDDAFAGDFYLVCSDGLTKMLSDDAIRDVVLAHAKDLERAAKSLVEKANAAGGRDNITVILIRVDEASLRVGAPDRRS